MKNRKLLCLFITLCCCLSAYQTMAQCGENPIQGFEVTQIEPTTGGAANGAITVQVTGGEAPFVYSLFADFGGKGKEVVQTSSATAARTYTFRNVAANAKSNTNGYVVAVQSSNQSEGNMPEAICQRRTISNIEVK
jgi:hypothetical protein